MPSIPALPFWPTTAKRSDRAFGRVELGSGRLVACDPFVMERAPVPFARTIPPGTYDVVLGESEGDRAYVALVVRPEAVARWEHARREGEAEHAIARKAPGFDVDASAGAYFDATAAARVFAERRRGPSLFDRLQEVGFGQRAVATLSLGPGLGVAAFGTGGDGRFPSFWGLDASGSPVVLVTDLGVLRSLDEDDAQGDTQPSGGAVIIPFPRRPRRT